MSKACPFFLGPIPPLPPWTRLRDLMCYGTLPQLFLQKGLTNAENTESHINAAPWRTSHHGSARAWGHLVVQYHGIDRCDRCGQPLEDGQWLSGLCERCEQAEKPKKRPVEVVEPAKGVL